MKFRTFKLREASQVSGNSMNTCNLGGKILIPTTVKEINFDACEDKNKNERKHKSNTRHDS